MRTDLFLCLLHMDYARIQLFNADLCIQNCIKLLWKSGLLEVTGAKYYTTKTPSPGGMGDKLEEF